eukprot:scaffold2707_cov417-Prasinococcus_capsulatus_cf.AAC.16
MDSVIDASDSYRLSRQGPRRPRWPPSHWYKATSLREALRSPVRHRVQAPPASRRPALAGQLVTICVHIAREQPRHTLLADASGDIIFGQAEHVGATAARLLSDAWWPARSASPSSERTVASALLVEHRVQARWPGVPATVSCVGADTARTPRCTRSRSRTSRSVVRTSLEPSSFSTRYLAPHLACFDLRGVE